MAWAQPAGEYQVKAVFLFRFAQFVEWPPEVFSDAQAPIVIGVLGEDPFGGFLDEAVAGERVNRRPLEVRRYRRMDEIGGCHILFIAESEEARLEQILGRLKGRAILTVGDSDGFARRGGMIRFVEEKNRIRFRVNASATRAAHLVISSKLLRSSSVIGGQN